MQAASPTDTLVPQTSGARDWIVRLGRYKLPDNRKAVRELALTAAPLAGLWMLMWALAAPALGCRCWSHRRLPAFWCGCS